MDTKTFFAPFQASMHTAAEQSLTLQKEAAELYQTQAKLAAGTMTQTAEAVRGMIAAQQQANLAMGKVLVDALKPADTKSA